jgi:hypothetical protein
MAQPPQIRDEAWIGDAVLGLFARQRLLEEDAVSGHGLSRQELYSGLTCNQFLSAFGEPTVVEAQIGRLYQREGLEAAFAWMDTHLLPQFRKQLNRRRPGGRKVR